MVVMVVMMVMKIMTVTTKVLLVVVHGYDNDDETVNHCEDDDTGGVRVVQDDGSVVSSVLARSVRACACFCISTYVYARVGCVCACKVYVCVCVRVYVCLCLYGVNEEMLIFQVPVEV
jgi:hypothetical protein